MCFNNVYDIDLELKHKTYMLGNKRKNLKFCNLRAKIVVNTDVALVKKIVG